MRIKLYVRKKMQLQNKTEDSAEVYEMQPEWICKETHKRLHKDLK